MQQFGLTFRHPPVALLRAIWGIQLFTQKRKMDRPDKPGDDEGMGKRC
jgi:hypothetical protein